MKYYTQQKKQEIELLKKDIERLNKIVENQQFYLEKIINKQVISLLKEAEILSNSNNFLEALEKYNEVLSLTSNRYDIIKKKADMLYFSNQHEQAIIYYTISIENSQDSKEKSQLLIHRAYPHYALGNYQLSFEDFKLAKQLDPKNIQCDVMIEFCVSKIVHNCDKLSLFF
jgi:tetratricopeptide (TPR) repeat protein